MYEIEMACPELKGTDGIDDGKRNFYCKQRPPCLYASPSIDVMKLVMKSGLPRCPSLPLSHET